MAQTMKVNVMVLVFMAVAALGVMFHGAEAAEYIVGDDLGWTIPPAGAPSYATWASKHNLHAVDDIIEFKFAVGEQDVAFVTKEDLDSCNTADPLHVFDKPVKIQFLVSDMYYVTSTLAGHCAKGQKMAFFIAPSSDSPSPSPSLSASADEKSPKSLNFVAQISGLGF